MARVKRKRCQNGVDFLTEIGAKRLFLMLGKISKADKGNALLLHCRQEIIVKTVIALLQLRSNHAPDFFELLAGSMAVNGTILNSGLVLILNSSNPDHKVLIKVGAEN